MNYPTPKAPNRNCIICGKSLTDAASLEWGIGPHCRNKANETLAREIPADLPKAQALAAGLSEGSVPPEAVATLATVKADVSEGMHNDWRATVKRCAWLLSFSPTSEFQSQVVDLVAALGYVGLAGLLTGEACTGAARVFFSEGRVHLEGPRNKAGRNALKAAVQGLKFHPQVGETPATWSAPHGQAAAFLGVVAKFWPCVEGAEQVLDAVELYEPPVPATVEAVQVKAKVLVAKVSGAYQVTSPWHPAFVRGIKALPWATRRWDPTLKVWEVWEGHKDALRGLILAHYGETPAVLA